MKNLLFAIFAVASTCTYAQYCVTGGPSSDGDSNIESVALIGASGSINYTGCPGVIGLEEHTSETAYLNAGEQYTVQIQFGTCGGNYAGLGEAWIDFNGDQVFDLSESIGTWTGTPPTAISNFTFTVPGGVSNGLIRMRVNQEETSTSPLDPCANFTWGSSTDFNIYLQNGIDCSGYIGNDADDPRIVNTLPFNESYNSQLCFTNENSVYSAPDVFYLILLNDEDAINVSLCGSTFDTYLSIMKTNGEVIAANDDFLDCGTSSQLDIETTGLDSLYVIVDGWGDQSGDYDIAISSVDLGIEKNQVNNISVYPNPTNGIISIENITPNSTIDLLDLSGKKIQTFGKVKSIDLRSFNKGVYFLSIESNGESILKKVVLL